MHYSSTFNIVNSPSELFSIFVLNFNFNINNFKVFSPQIPSINKDLILKFTSNNLKTQSTTETSLMTENSSTGRFTRFSNLMVNYDYKCGHYLGI